MRYLIISLSLFFAGCDIIKSEDEQRKAAVTESLKYIQSRDTANFLKLFAERNLIKDSAELFTHFGMAADLIGKYGLPEPHKIVFGKPKNAVGDLAAGATVDLLPLSAITAEEKMLRLEYVFLNDNPEAKKFIDFKLSTVD